MPELKAEPEEVKYPAPVPVQMNTAAKHVVSTKQPLKIEETSQTLSQELAKRLNGEICQTRASAEFAASSETEEVKSPNTQATVDINVPSMSAVLGRMAVPKTKQIQGKRTKKNEESEPAKQRRKKKKVDSQLSDVLETISSGRRNETVPFSPAPMASIFQLLADPVLSQTQDDIFLPHIPVIESNQDCQQDNDAELMQGYIASKPKLYQYDPY